MTSTTLPRSNFNAPSGVGLGYHSLSNMDAFLNRRPPPLHSPATHGTLGPIFSDEEDGDDSEFIAAKMAQLGFGPDGRVYPTSKFSNRSPPSPLSIPPPQSVMQGDILQVLQQQQADRLRQQQQMLLSQLPSPLPTPPPYYPVSGQTTTAQQAALNQQLRSQRLNQEQVQRLAMTGNGQPGAFTPAQQQLLTQLQQLHQQQLRQMQMMALQQNFATALEQSTPPVSSQPPPVGKPRISTFNRLDDTYDQPSSQLTTNKITMSQHSTASTFTSPPPSATTESHSRAFSAPSKIEGLSPPPKGRFAQARQEIAASGGISPVGSLQALLSRRQAQATSSPSESPHVSPTSATSDDSIPRNTAREALQALGRGRPQEKQTTNRSATLPVPLVPALATVPAARAASVASAPVRKTAIAIRQPHGPPGDADKLKEDNFKALARRKAGLGLGMLNRRSEPTTPSVA